MTKAEFLQGFLDTTDEEKVGFARKAGELLHGLFSDETKYLNFMRASAAFFAAADNQVHPTEVAMYNMATGDNLSYEQFFNLTKELCTNEEFVKGYWEFVNGLDQEVRTVLCYYALAVIGFDDTFSKEEVALIMPLLPDFE